MGKEMMGGSSEAKVIKLFLFITEAPGACTIKLFTAVIYGFS
jgi:hypothetical protein